MTDIIARIQANRQDRKERRALLAECKELVRYIEQRSTESTVKDACEILAFYGATIVAVKDVHYIRYDKMNEVALYGAASELKWLIKYSVNGEIT